MKVEIFSAAELAAIHAYHRPFYLDAALHDPVTLALLVLVCRFAVRPLHRLSERFAAGLFTRLGNPRVRMLERLWGGSGWGTAVIFSVLFTLLLVALGLPETLYINYVLPHREGLSVISPARFSWNFLEGLVLELVLMACLALGLFGLIRRVSRWWLLLGLGAGALVLVSAALDPYQNRRVFTQAPLPPGPLQGRITALMADAHVDFGKIVVEARASSTHAVDAYFAGQGPTRSIVLTDTLIDRMSTDEVLAVVAHEAGHLGEARWRGRLAAALALLVIFYGLNRVFLLFARRGWMGVRDAADIRLLPLITLGFFVVEVVAAPLANAATRQRELDADRYAVSLTRHPERFTSMLTKLARINRLDPSPPRWVVLLDSSHPSIDERIAAISPGL